MLKALYFWICYLIGRVVMWLLNSSGRGGGSALPGLVIERINPGFLSYGLSQLKNQPVIVSGTNGKTTTTKLLAEILTSQGLKVFTNPSGSNFTRGVVSELVRELEPFKPVSQQFDIAVLELDEAYAKHFAEQIDIGTLMILNISRDQLDRFGEVDATRKLLEHVAQSAETIVLNRLEPSTPKMYELFTSQGKNIELFSASDSVARGIIVESATERSSAGNLPNAHATTLSSVKQIKDDGLSVEIELGIGDKLDLELPRLQGLYNGLNFTAALATAQSVLGELDLVKIKNSADKFRPAWGRSQIFEIDGQRIHLLLVKNPSGYNHALQEFGQDPDSVAIFGLNDNYADGRDVSWIWDVDFSQLRFADIYSTGLRSYDMGLRLIYADLPIQTDHIEPDWQVMLDKLLSDKTKPKVKFFATYTVMTEVYKYLTARESKGAK